MFPITHLWRKTSIVGTTLKNRSMPLGFRITEENQHSVANELIDSAAMGLGDHRHFSEIFVKDPCQILRLHLFGCRGKVLDVGEEYRQLLALGVNRNILLAG